MSLDPREDIGVSRQREGREGNGCARLFSDSNLSLNLWRASKFFVPDFADESVTYADSCRVQNNIKCHR